PGCFYLGIHIGQLKGNGLVIAYFSTESLSYFGIRSGQFIGTGCNSQCLAGNTYTPPGQGFHGKFKSETIFSYTVFFRHLYIIKYQGVRITTANTQFLFFGAYLKTFHSFLDNQNIDAVMFFTGIRLGYNEVNTRSSSVGNPVLGTVE